MTYSTIRAVASRRHSNAGQRFGADHDPRNPRGRARCGSLAVDGILYGVLLVLAAVGCGGQPGNGRLHVTSLSLTAANGFPGSPSS